MSQSGLSDFGDGDRADSVVAEAEAVAGQGGQPTADVVDAEDVQFPDPDGELELLVTQVNYTIEGQGREEYPVIHVFGRTADNEAKHVRVIGFRPYFYAPTESLTDEDLDRDTITGTEEGYESIRGDELTRIYGRTPRDVGGMRDEFDHYEADILFPNRFLIDKDINDGIRVPARYLDADTVQVPHEEVEPAAVEADLRVNFFDLEVDDRSGFPEEGEEPIVCLSSHDSYTDEYVAWLYEAPVGDGVAPDQLEGYDAIHDDTEIDVRSFDSEESMLSAFLEYLDETDPDVLSGWNFEDFDAPYLLDRLERLDGGTDHDLNPNRLSRVDEVWRSGWGGPNVKGRVVFDLLYAYKRTQFTELESYRLDAVAELELDVGKERYTGDLGDLWENDPERLLEYNLRDVELCVEIDHKQEVIPFWNEVRTFVGCKLEDAPTPGDAVDVYVLHKVHGEFALPSKGRTEGEEYEGGAVFDPITGVKDNVTVLDLKCFSEDTDVLTPSGSRSITELSVGDEIYTLNPETFECEVDTVAETHQYGNSYGELHHLSGNTHDFKVTENHRFLVSKERDWDAQSPADFDAVPYRDIPDYERFAFPQHEPMAGEDPDTFDLAEEVDGGHVVIYTDDDLRAFRSRTSEAVREHLDLAHGSSTAMGIQRAVGKYLLPLSVYRNNRTSIEAHADEIYLKHGRQHREIPMSFAMDDWLALLGWYVTEGSIDTAGQRITIHQQDETGRKRIRELLDRMGINHNVGDHGIHISNRYLREWLADNCGTGSANKRLPDWVFDLDSSLLETVLEAMIRGDGSQTDSGLRKFWTISEHLRDAVADIAVRCGHKPTVSKQQDGTWYVSIGKRGSFKKSTNATVEDHDGDVHCVTATNNHVILAGRNGNYQWVGQSLYPMCMVTTNASPETKVDPDEFDGETYHSPNGIHFRKEPDGIIRAMVDELLEEREQKKARRNAHDPGSQPYEQFDRQQAAVKVIMNCFTPDTEVLTPEGIRDIRDLDVGDEVYSLDPDSMQMEVKPVTETHAYPEYSGKIVDIQTNTIDFRVTPNHRMLVRKNETNGITDDSYRFVQAGELDRATNYELPHDWSTDHGNDLDEVDLTRLLDPEDEYEVWVRPSVHGRTFITKLGWQPRRVLKNDLGEVGYVFSPAEFEQHREYIESVCERSFVHAESGRKWIPRLYDGDNVLQLLAWYVTEGSVYTATEKQFGETLRGSATSIQLAQDAIPDGGQSDHESIGNLLDQMGFDYYVDDSGYQFTSKLLGELLTDLCGGNSFEKRIPNVLWECSERQKRLFLETLVDGDGDRQPNSWRYTTSSEQLRDDVLKLCTHLGLTVKYGANSGSWRIYVDENSKNTLRMHRSSTQSTAENGVYCVTVADNHTLLAGRNGKFQFVGQSLYGVLGWDRFRLYDQEMGAAVTATGRDVIKHTEQAAAELDKEVIYGDSVTGDRPIIVRDSQDRVRIVPIERLYERATATDEATELISADGGAVGSASVPKERATLDGWDALSLSETGQPEWQPITQVIRHRTDEPVVRLQHKFGESVTTRDHSYVVPKVDDTDQFPVGELGTPPEAPIDGLEEVPPTEVTEPLRVPGVPAITPVETIDVYEILDGYTRTYEDGRGGRRGQTVEKTKHVHADEQYVWFGQNHHADLDSTIKVQRYVDLDSEDGAALLRLLAAYITEGSATTEETFDVRFGASIAESRREWLAQLQDDYHRLFTNATASIIASDAGGNRELTYGTDAGEETIVYDDQTLKLQMMNELTAVFFRECAGQTSREKHIPSFVFHAPSRRQKLFLDVLVEGDGSREFPRYTDTYAERNFDFETTSRMLAAGVSMLLQLHDRKHSFKYRDETGSYTVQTVDSYRQGDPPSLTQVDHDGYVYDLSVATNENFVDAVGGIVLHNTDSVMLELGKDVTTEQAIEESFELEEYINDSYDEFALDRLNAETHRFQIEFEKLYRRFFQAGKKKRYAGRIVWKEGKDVDDIDITGFEYKRSDIAPVTKEVQKRILEMIVTGEDEEVITEYLHDVITDFQAGNLDLEEVAIPGGIGKRLSNYDTDTAQVRGAKYANLLLGTNFQRGSKPTRLYLRKVHPDFFVRVEREKGLNPQTDPLYAEFKRDPDVICFEYADQLPDEFEIDWEKMLDKTLKGPISRVIEALGISWEEVKTGQEQTGLGQFT